MSAPENITIPVDLYFEVMSVLRNAPIYIDMPEEGEGGDPVTGAGGFKPWKWEGCRPEAAAQAYAAYKAMLETGTAWFEAIDKGEVRQNCRVGCAIAIRRGDYVLLGKRAAHLPSGGKWALVGGSVDNEPATAGAAREMVEEVGLTDPINLRPMDFWYDENLPVPNGAPYVCVFFECEAPDGWEPELREPDKCDGWEWVKMCDAGFRDLMVGTGAAVDRLYQSALDDMYYGS